MRATRIVPLKIHEKDVCPSVIRYQRMNLIYKYKYYHNNQPNLWQ